MSLDTLLKAAEFVELSTGPTTEENPSNARAIGNHPNNLHSDRRRVVSESEASERRRRPGGAGTRETHNKLEKNRRAHLKECFDILKKQVPSLEEKKTSNLNILRGALKHIQTIKKQEQDYALEFDLLKSNNKTLAERLNLLQSNSKSNVGQKSLSGITQDDQAPQAFSSSIQTLPSTTAANPVGESRTPPISVATQTSPSGDLVGSATGVEDTSNKCNSTSSTDTGGEGEESDRKLSTCDDNEDEKTDTDEGLSNSEDENDEIDVVGQDDSPSNESLHMATKDKVANSSRMNGEVEGSKIKVAEISKGQKNSRFNNIKARKRSKSGAGTKNEEDSDYDENTKEEPKAKIQACARVSV